MSDPQTTLPHQENDGFDIHERDGKWLVTDPYIDYWIICSTEEMAKTISDAFEKIKNATANAYSED